MGFREDAARALLAEYRAHPAGRPPLYWQDVLGPGEVPPRDWCGAFVLYGLHKAGLAKSVRWINGIGFASPEDLPITSNPKIGDLLYVQEPFQHHAMVIGYDPNTKIVTTVDGNQPGIAIRQYHLSRVLVYSIQQFVDAAEAEFQWGTVVWGAAVFGAVSWVYLNGLPRPVERQIRRIAA